jgi:hypothetical protein
MTKQHPESDGVREVWFREQDVCDYRNLILNDAQLILRAAQPWPGITLGGEVGQVLAHGDAPVFFRTVANLVAGVVGGAHPIFAQVHNGAREKRR